MDNNDLQLLFGYNQWANARVLNACSALPAETLFAPAPISFGSIMGTLAHILGAEIAWRQRMQEGISPTRLPDATDFSDLQTLIACWKEEEAAMQHFIDGLDEAGASRVVAFTTLSGKPQHSTLWKALAHVVNHGTAFRAEAGAALGALGHSPGDLDMIHYLRETDQR